MEMVLVRDDLNPAYVIHNKSLSTEAYGASTPSQNHYRVLSRMWRERASIRRISWVKSGPRSLSRFGVVNFSSETKKIDFRAS